MNTNTSMTTPTATFTLSGALRLAFGLRDWETVITEQFDQAPLKVVRPFDIGNGRILVQVINSTAGVLGGDRFSVDISVGPGAKVLLVNQSATKAHRMPPGVSASEHVKISVADGGELEYYPGLVIPFPGADFSQSLAVDIGGKSKFGCLGLYAMGRVSAGEYLAFRRLSSRTKIRVAGRPAYADALELEPAAVDPEGWGLLEGNRYAASGYWYWDEMAEYEDINQPQLMLVSGIPANGHAYLRGLAQDGLVLQKAVRDFLDKQRGNWGMAPVDFERYMGILGR